MIEKSEKDSYMEEYEQLYSEYNYLNSHLEKIINHKLPFLNGEVLCYSNSNKDFLFVKFSCYSNSDISIETLLILETFVDMFKANDMLVTVDNIRSKKLFMKYILIN